MLQIDSLTTLENALKTNKQQADDKTADTKLFKVSGTADHCYGI